MTRPTFFLVGAPKCGTTSLCHYLSQHPDIFMLDRKEIHFLTSDLDIPTRYRTESEYLNIFARTTRPHSGEGSTWYLYSTAAAHGIHKLNRHVKIIISLRRPADMVYSLFRFRQYIGVERSSCLENALARESEYLSNLGHKTKVNPSYIYCDAAMYYRHVERYIEIFGSTSVHVVLFDELKNDPEKVYQGILQFLGVRGDFRPAFTHVNKTGRIRSEGFQQFIAHLPGPVKRLAYAVPRGIRRPAYRALHRLNTSYAPPSPLDPELLRCLSNQFRPDVERLSALIGRNLTHWCAE